jgi:uncharacterized protein YqgC (DUF456 family)
VAIGLGILGTIVPVIPGPLLVAAAIAVWAIVVGTTPGWIVLGVALVLLVGGQVLKYLTAGRVLISSGAPRSSLFFAGVLGIVGFFVIPVVGLALGFVGGLYLAERRRLGAGPASMRSTRTALRAVGLGILIELASALFAGGAWLGAVLGVDGILG